MNQPSWKYRRRAVFGTLGFSAIVIISSLFIIDNQSLAETTVLSAFGLMGAIIAAYIGGAAYEDVRLPKHDDFDDTIYDDERNLDVH